MRGFREMDHPTTRRTTTKKMGADRLRNEKPETTKKKQGETTSARLNDEAR
jgi:hypothetical protein